VRKRAVILTATAVVVALILLAVVLSRQRVRRHRLFRAEPRVSAPSAIPPVNRWTETFTALAADDLAALLDRIEQRHPDLYARYSLGYLHARALLEDNEPDDAARKLAPFLAPGNPFRDLALYHSGRRQELIFGYARSIYRDEAIDEEADRLSGPALVEFVRRVAPSLSTARRRDLTARVVEKSGDVAGALALLKGGTSDDAADRVSRVLDRPEIIRRMSPEQRALLGEAFQEHRHYDRAVALLSSALTAALPPQKRDELRFAVGRSYFGAEKYSQAQQTYLLGANTTRDLRMKATFLLHASRAAQLRGDDAGGERLMTAAIAVKGTFPATTVALTQRIRTRVKQKRFAEAASDLQQLRRMAPNDRAIVEGSLAYALGILGAGQNAAAVATLNAVPGKLLNPHDKAEFAYWRARALEARDPGASFREYLTVLRSSVPTHFAYFARERLDAPSIKAKLGRELALRDAQVQNLITSKQFAVAKEVQTDRILLSSADRPTHLQRLATIYRELPAYRPVLELQPEPLPAFPLSGPADRTALLMAMSLCDEATDGARERYPLRQMRSALTQALALNRGRASRQSIYAVEVLMKRVPSDFIPDLLPSLVRQLLFPRYFYPFIVEDAKKYEADPVLVLAIMREESRFDPRAKSAAAARGLLQFIISTARDIGRDIGMVDVDAEDLYDPRVIISLGAKYVAELSEKLDGNRYRIAAAYNAGPNQVALWTRLAPAAGDDWFLSAINFDETKHYVRIVMNSYKRYHEIYGGGGPAGGIRIEP
jgi:soluble lytic murein transglycosylase-like protein